MPFYLQFYVVAHDSAGVDQKNSTTLIYIRLKRDQRPPIFESLPYTISIKETQGLGPNNAFFNLRGRDDDKMVIFLYLPSDAYRESLGSNGQMKYLKLMKCCDVFAHFIFVGNLTLQYFLYCFRVSWYTQ